jgi:hypothetical protein
MTSQVHKHLRRLDSVWIESPIYFLTLCTAGRRPMLASEDAVAVVRTEFLLLSHDMVGRSAGML